MKLVVLILWSLQVFVFSQLMKTSNLTVTEQVARKMFWTALAACPALCFFTVVFFV